MSRIADNLSIVNDRITEACARAGREPGSVTLIAVSKTHPADAVLEASAAGQWIFGENKVQELLRKAEALRDLRPSATGQAGPIKAEQADISWHMIGHLQLNKVKYLPGIVTLIHSVDSLKLASEIERQWARLGETADILIEVNMAGEDTKYGLAPGEVPAFVREVAGLSHLHIKGLMTIAPYTEDPETNRPYFRGLRKLMEEINSAHIPGGTMDTLSMGMSGDYEVAVEEGATLVRVGTAIFGERDYDI